MTDNIKVKALKPFSGKEGYKDARSKPFEVSKQRLAELKANGLVEEVCGTKKAAESDNKKAQEPANKSERDPLDHDGDGRKGGSLPKAQRETKA